MSTPKRKKRYDVSVLTGTWAIQSAYSELEGKRIFDAYLAGSYFDMDDEPDENKPHQISLKDNSGKYVTVIPIFGAMTVGSQMCGPVGIKTIAERIATAAVDVNSIGAILHFNSPGGQTATVPILREAILEHKAIKPILAFGDLIASAALMSAGACHEIGMPYGRCVVGSLGVMASFYNDTERLKLAGYERHVIYSTLSGDKNAAYDSALTGDYARLQTDVLDPLAAEAIDNMKADRPQISADSVYSAQDFFAIDAQKIGLIDFIGNMQHAVERVKAISSQMPKVKTQPTKNIQPKIKSKSLAMNKISSSLLPFVMLALGLSEITANEEGAFVLPEGAAEKLQADFFAKFKKPLALRGFAQNADGSFEASAFQLAQLNKMFQDAENEAQREAIESANATIAHLSGLPEPPVGGTTVHTAYLAPKTIGSSNYWDIAATKKLAYLQEKDRAKKAQLRNEFNSYMSGLSSTLVVDQMNTELGAYHRAQNTSVIDFMWPTESADSIFPYLSTGQYDEMPQTALFTEEFIQARNATWAEKGGFEFQADKTKLKAYQVSTVFSEERMFAFMQTWLAEMAKGDHPFHQSFVDYLIQKIAIQVKAEIQQNLVKGYYVAPANGVAGPAKHAIHGLLAVLQTKYAENRMLPTFNGKPEYSHYTETGEANLNHLYFKVEGIIMSMPQELRDGGTWNIYLSKEDKRAYELFAKQVIEINANYADLRAALKRENFNIVAVPNWPDGAIVIAQPGMIRQGYREKGNDNQIYVQREKRDTIAFMDGAHVIEPMFTGYKFATRAALIAANRTKQFIFTNGNFGPLSPLDLDANATTADAKLHFAFKTSTNSSATTFGAISNLVVGQTIYLIGGSNTNPTTIATNNTNFVGITSALVLSSGVVAEFVVTAASKLALVSKTSISNTGMGIIKFTTDDQTPSVAGGYEFEVSTLNAADKVEITGLTDAQIGADYVIRGATATNQCVLKNNSTLILGADITMTSGTVVTLRATNLGTFVKL